MDSEFKKSILSSIKSIVIFIFGFLLKSWRDKVNENKEQKTEINELLKVQDEQFKREAGHVEILGFIDRGGLSVDDVGGMLSRQVGEKVDGSKLSNYRKG